MAGAAAAHTLLAKGYDVVVIEQNDRLGGRVHTHVVHGAAVEMGAGFLNTRYVNLLSYLVNAGLDKQLHRYHGNVGLYTDGRVRMITPGTLISSKLLSGPAKARGAAFMLKTFANWRHLDMPTSFGEPAYTNRSVADTYTSAAGREFMELVLEPIIDGYFYWNPEHTSQTMMHMVAKLVVARTYKMRGGLQRIPETAVTGSEVLLGHTVQSVRRAAEGSYEITAVSNGKQRKLYTSGVICATTASAVPHILTDLTHRQRDFFSAVRYSTGALIARTYKEEQTLGAKSIAFPRREKTGLASVTLAAESTAGGDAYATVKTYASGTTAARVAALPDEQLIDTLVRNMAPVRDSVLTRGSKPVATHVQRWHEALPFFDSDHFKRLQAFTRGEIENVDSALTFAGDYIGGPCMEGAFTSGVQAARRLDERLHRQ